jgi:hypothetical protein
MSEIEQQARAQAAAILERLAFDPATPRTPVDAACRRLFYGVERAEVGAWSPIGPYIRSGASISG